MPEKLKCGVVGAGWWATFAHIPALLAHPRAELIAIQKRDLAEARKVADDFGIPYACTTAEELLNVDGLNAVVVSSSPNMHYEQASAALRLGKHVLIEKPMTLTTVEAVQLQHLADQRRLQLLISCPWHYTPHASIARHLVGSGSLGKVRMISVLMTNPISHLLRGSSTLPTHGTPYLHPRKDTYSDPKIAGAGQIYAQVCHVVAYISFLTGRRAEEVFARFHKDGAVLDIYDTLNLKLEGDAIISIASTGATSLDRRDFEIRVFGTEGILFLDLWRGHMEFQRMSGSCETYPNLESDQIYPHEAPATNLIDSILDPSRNQSPASLGVAAMEVIEAACISAANGKNVFVRDIVGKSI